jgi:nitroreductase
LPHEEEFKTLLGIPPKKRILTLLPIGVAAETPAPKKKPLERVLHWEVYGCPRPIAQT